MPYLRGSDPILSCAQAAEFERLRFAGDESLEWPAMRAAGAKVARGVMADLAVAGVTPDQPGRILVLVGKGHNGGDALLAASAWLRLTGWSIEVGFVFGQNQLRPLAQAAWRELQTTGGVDRVRAIRREAIRGEYLAVIDGIFGFQFRPPLPSVAQAWLQAADGLPVRLRAAVDLPSGLDEANAFVADATYATGIFKAPLLDLPNAGRLRYLDIGFFPDGGEGETRILTPEILQPLRALRDARVDKRTYGQLAVVGGSRSYPGAVAMSVAAALQSGVGNVTALVPESLAAALAARWPEAMWVGCPETEDGGIAMEAGLAIRQKISRATALLVGPGLGREPETQALVADIIREAKMPLVIDADALQPELVDLGKAPRVLTPHTGEFARIAGGKTLVEFQLSASVVTVLKGPITRVSADGVIYHGIEGGPMLARGGSGDLLAGLIGGRLAAEPTDPALAASQGVYWHGRAAQQVARQLGETAVRTTALLAELNPALRQI